MVSCSNESLTVTRQEEGNQNTRHVLPALPAASSSPVGAAGGSVRLHGEGTCPHKGVCNGLGSGETGQPQTPHGGDTHRHTAPSSLGSQHLQVLISSLRRGSRWDISSYWVRLHQATKLVPWCWFPLIHWVRSHQVESQ